jgi:hypothetical protein
MKAHDESPRCSGGFHKEPIEALASYVILPRMMPFANPLPAFFSTVHDDCSHGWGKD